MKNRNQGSPTEAGGWSMSSSDDRNAVPGTGARIVGLLITYRTVLILILIVTVLHYNTAIHIHALHGIYRRLYYFPIILAAFRGGTAGGLGASLLVNALYFPHAVGWIGWDPANPVEKSLEMLLYLAVGLLSGILVSRINAARDLARTTASELKTALDEKTAMEDQLIRSTRLAAVGRLSAGLAHEIRNPLASIKGSAEVLNDDFPARHPKARILAILLEETNRLNQVLTRFLTFARSEPGQQEQVDLCVEAKQVTELASNRQEFSSIVVRKPPADFGPVRANREQVRQVLLNLVLNAASAAGPDGNVELRFASEADGFFSCIVCDDGPGFTDEALELFGTPFFSTREGGTGLGIATSLRITEDLGGRLTVDTQARDGACVQLSLPPATDSKGMT